MPQGSLTRSGSHRAQQRVIAAQPGHRIAEDSGVGGVGDQAGLTVNDHLGDSPEGRSHRRDADRRRREQAHRMPFLLTGEHRQMRRSQVVPHPFALERADERHVVVEAK